MVFGSVRGLSQFTADEIAEMGFDILWTAFEGSGKGYDKLKGQDLDGLYQGLKSRGVAIHNSMIVGFPFRTGHRSWRISESSRSLVRINGRSSSISLFRARPFIARSLPRGAIFLLSMACANTPGSHSPGCKRRGSRIKADGSMTPSRCLCAAGIMTRGQILDAGTVRGCSLSASRVASQWADLME